VSTFKNDDFDLKVKERSHTNQSKKFEDAELQTFCWMKSQLEHLKKAEALNVGKSTTIKNYIFKKKGKKKVPSTRSFQNQNRTIILPFKKTVVYTGYPLKKEPWWEHGRSQGEQKSLIPFCQFCNS